MSTNHDSLRAATALIDYRAGTGSAPLPVRQLCQRLLNAVGSTGGESGDPRALAGTLEALAARDAVVDALVRDLSGALPPDPAPRESGGGGMHVNVSGSGHVVPIAGRNMYIQGNLPSPAARPSEAGDRPLFTVLFTAASPEAQDTLRVDRESRAVREELEKSGLRGRIQLEVRMAARVEDLLDGLLDYRPRVVHFAGHGAEDGRLLFEDEGDDSLPAAAKGLKVIFSQLRGTVECVVLNACFSRPTAKALLASVPYVIAMEGALADHAAVKFSTGFYKALAKGCSVPEAFQFGRGLLMTKWPWQKPPVLLGPPQ